MDRNKIRSLVLRDEHIGHPFRQQLPVRIFQIARNERAVETAGSSEKRLGEDTSLFLLSFLAFFTAFYTFIF